MQKHTKPKHTRKCKGTCFVSLYKHTYTHMYAHVQDDPDWLVLVISAAPVLLWESLTLLLTQCWGLIIIMYTIHLMWTLPKGCNTTAVRHHHRLYLPQSNVLTSSAHSMRRFSSIVLLLVYSWTCNTGNHCKCNLK